MPQPRQVLFLCTGNYYRSRFAEIMFNHLAPSANLNWSADSSGLNIALLLTDGNDPGPISIHTQDGLKLRNIPLAASPRRSKQVTESELAAAHLIIALKEHEHRPLLAKLHPEWQDRVRYWHVHDLDFQSPEPALAEIEQLVRDLIEELKRKWPMINDQ